IDEVRTEVARLVMVENIQAVILDYWQLIQAAQRDQSKGHAVRTAQIFQQLAVEHHVAFVVTVQLDDYG
ncbi:DnaB-like helicase C-terminal domain-containing protein, partial [Streptococcus pneumoniae]|uniref:DnaB-like helicase C-terminal domain-containing protein n=1 Tax=Streptococcus pneumoniae TaxID=1313 RepID=UPI0013D97B86